ncbi:hypothetical protein KDN24_02185 [Bacillus sp. Bva_UNVM-123]|uniref:hypothetical protein n=1 Tax=Bacillus sp. Bva_UNVM-123 TaxID=2829798 RepID=UPI00391F0B1E
MKPTNYIKLILSFENGVFVSQNPEGTLVEPDIVLNQLVHDYELNESRSILNLKTKEYEEVKLQDMKSLYIEFK